ncbi:hypothetical protein TB2_040853 [Malus domestica]
MVRPSGGFTVGRFSGERELPVVYTEMDGGFNGNGAPIRVLWAPRSKGSESRRIQSAFHSEDRDSWVKDDVDLGARVFGRRQRRHTTCPSSCH